MSVGLYETESAWMGDPYGFGDTPGMAATSPQGFTGAMNDGGPIGGPAHQQAKASAASQAGLMGNPITGLVIFGILVLVIMFTIHHFGKEDSDFTNIRASAYNVLIVSFMAAAGIPLIRTVSAAYANAGLPGGKDVNAYLSGSGAG